jgi:hypothetical protein
MARATLIGYGEVRQVFDWARVQLVIGLERKGGGL